MMGHFVDREGFMEYGNLLAEMIKLQEKRLALLGEVGFEEVQYEIKELQKVIDTYEQEVLKVNK